MRYFLRRRSGRSRDLHQLHIESHRFAGFFDSTAGQIVVGVALIALLVLGGGVPR